jgi:hypothetical protein
MESLRITHKILVHIGVKSEELELVLQVGLPPTVSSVAAIEGV